MVFELHNGSVGYRAQLKRAVQGEVKNEDTDAIPDNMLAYRQCGERW
jgi:hypothetical protein